MSYLEKLFKKTGYMSIIESIIFALLGAILICKPEGTVKAITCIVSIIFICIGIYKIISFFMAKGKYDFYNYNLLYGLMACIIGVVAIVYSTTISTIFRIMIGIWIIYSSFMRMNFTIKLKALNSNVWIYSLILAIIIFICGLYILINSGAVVVTVGIIMLIYSIIDIIEDVIFIKNIKEIF